MTKNKNSTPSSLYHYTSSKVVSILLQNIIDTKFDDETIPMLTLHASEVHYMNDKNENGIIINNLYLKSETIIDKFKQITKELNKVFVLSLGNSRDCLPMWLIYGNNGCGLSLRFDFKQLKKLFKVISVKNIDKENLRNEILLVECEYLSNKDILQRAKLYRDNLKGAIKNGQTESELISIFNNFQIKSTSLKHKCFEYETEYRLLKQTKSCLLKNGKYGITLYQTIEIPLFTLKEIMIGPMCNYETTQEALTYLCAKIYDKFKLKINISKSHINIK